MSFETHRLAPFCFQTDQTAQFGSFTVGKDAYWKDDDIEDPDNAYASLVFRMNVFTAFAYIPGANLVAMLGFFYLAYRVAYYLGSKSIQEEERAQFVWDLVKSGMIALVWPLPLIIFTIESVAQSCLDTSVFSSNRPL